ncbi:Acyl transferase/acyl hydrolase/lysophospholipase [Penicillium malachiteum]|uniref:Acyl transferase/acyl hydrolase/lysophospholipase n=1 Tax=Penicillium malachiteum TaxID=1324776 RepID=UPI002548E64D|nr:Acyl transferase/acyl hydrolase/lysophospholipase [Penicillium malachiteum]KAJ5730275.1 Acyl transferase/acyl hydrolase/lysophospholipase [Penicillium malachiteum]
MTPLKLFTTHGDGAMPPDVVESIAVVGLATRFPQEATTTEALWELLLQARSTWSPIPKERFNASAFYHPDPEHGGTFHVQGGHFLSEDPAYFDGSFFNITKTELLTLDPQQRMVLENVYHALENSGIPMNTAVGSNTSVFVSGFNHDYLGILNSDPETALKYKPTGVVNAILSNRISWFFDLKGPSMTIDTACSSSLVALHLAVQSLRSRETNMALVSGVSILENPVETVGMSHHGLLGSQGRCFSFDSRAEGYARGEGVGTVVLKPLSSAIRDGDTIRAVIRETGVNQDGRTSGITVPSSEAQERLIRKVYWRAGLNMEQTRFVEAHGTGTSTGDPIEAGALAKAFKCRRDTPLYIGTIKSTIGHLEGGSGVASLIKSILILESGIIPPNFDIQKINPKVPAEEWNIEFPKAITPWPSDGLRRISVNSFGIGGANAHCVLDDAYHYLQNRRISATHRTKIRVPRTVHIKDQTIVISRSRYSETDSSSDSADEGDILERAATPETPGTDGSCLSPYLGPMSSFPSLVVPKLFLISAFDEEGVKRTVEAYSGYIGPKLARPNATDYLLDDLSLTLSKHRSIFQWKSFVTASTVSELASHLSESRFSKPVRAPNAPDVHFVFTGQGAQYQSMGRSLLIYPVFQESLEEASKYIRRLGSPWSLIDELLADDKVSRVSLPEIAHPVCTALQVAIIDLLASWNIFPSCVTGHSSGEIASAYCAGRISREGAWKVAYYRGYVSSKQLAANGAMMAVGLSSEQLESYLKCVHNDHQGELIIACYNSPTNNTVSGDEGLVDCLKKRLDTEGVFARKLNVQNAYHSAHMTLIAKEYLQLMGNFSSGKRLAVPHFVHMFSTVTGSEVTSAHLSGQYWVDNMVSPVRFTSGLKAMRSQLSESNEVSPSVPFVVEIGPHSTLRSAIKETLSSEESQSEHKYFAVLNRSDQSLNALINTVGALAANGYHVDLHEVNSAARGRSQRPSRLLIDLPPYSFKHGERNLYESRLSRNLRSRKFPRHDLFGAPVPDWNANAPRWRHFVRLNENPWLRDHVVTGNFVYPGVGYLVMAIEGARQLSDGKRIEGFQLRKVSIKRALIVPDTKAGIEVSLSMTSVDGPSDLRTWRRFQISSFNESSDEWTEHCTGYIAVEIPATDGPIDNGLQKEKEARAWKDDFEKAQKSCTKLKNFSDTYDDLDNIELSFGPLFRNLHDVQMSGTRSGLMTGSVRIPDIAESMPMQYMHSHLIHPATMDSMIHMMIAAMIDFIGKPTLDYISLPTHVRDMWISSSLRSNPSHVFKGHASVSEGSTDKLEGQIRILDNQDRPCIRMDGIELTPLKSSSSQDSERRLCTSIEWNPDVNFLNSSQACELSSISGDNHDENRYWVKQLQIATMLYVTDALFELGDLEVDKLDFHMRRFHEWMIYWCEMLVKDEIIHLPYADFQSLCDDQTAKHAIFCQIETHSAEGAITARMGRNIAAVMRKEVDPLALMFGEDNVMESVYKEGLHLYDLPTHLKSYLSLLRQQHSGLKILEIGGGTGSFTAEVFNILAPGGSTGGVIASYTFTDISAGFFEKAKQRFHAWSDIMTFQSCNIEKSPTDQGLELGSYDLIFAGNVIHATKNLHTSLGNLRSLLRSGGQLVMQEGIRQDFLWYPLVFGQLPGWWLGDEPMRKWCPYIPTSDWNTLLTESGFSGVTIEYPSSADKDLTWQSILVATASVAKEQVKPDVFILTSGSQATENVIASLKDEMRLDFPAITVVNPSQLSLVPSSNGLCISLVDLEGPFLSQISEFEYGSIRKLLTQCQNILWLTSDSRHQPFSSMSMGLLRTVRHERHSDDSNIVSLTISNEEKIPIGEIGTTIHQICLHQFTGASRKERHVEYLLSNKMIHVGRLHEWRKADHFVTADSTVSVPEELQLSDVSRSIELVVSSADPRQTFWVTDHQHGLDLGTTEVEVDTCAIGMNTDLNSSSRSTEASGVVKRVGSAVEGIVPGDKVIVTGAAKNHCFRTSLLAESTRVVRVPDEISIQVAAGLPSLYATALYGLEEIAHLCESDNLLIHNGATSLGQAALQYAKMVGATSYVTVSTTKDREFLVSEYGIPAANIFSSKDLNFAKSIMRSTNGVGVNVVFNTLTGDALQETLSCLAPFGHFIHISRKGARLDAMIDLAPLQKCATVTTIDIELMMESRPELIARLVQNALALHVSGKICQVRPFTVMNFSQIQDGVESSQSSEGVGKIVFVPDPSNIISVVPDPLPAYQFDDQASYILAGGLGGIGRGLARWMASRGAKNLIFLSRSGRITEPVEEMIANLKTIGCRSHVFTCDVSDADRVRAVVEECSASLPPIKGCVQGSMVLRDGAFAGMSFENWQAAIQPKVQGSWNLHEILPADLDFFVMLSSVAGIFGNRGQSNYAAGNTFQDALAAHRTSKGMKATSINLGSVSNVGWVAENIDTSQKHTDTLFQFLREEEVYKTIEFMIDDRQKKQDTIGGLPQSQVVLGLPTGEMCRQNNIPKPAYLEYPLFTHMREAVAATSSEKSDEKTVNSAALIAATINLSDTVTVVSNGIIERLSSLLAIPSSEIDAQRFSFGSIDSLVSMEFVSWIVKELKAEVALLDIMGAQNIQVLSEKIAQTTRLTTYEK